jgi:hypothetical protein
LKKLLLSFFILLAFFINETDAGKNKKETLFTDNSSKYELSSGNPPSLELLKKHVYLLTPLITFLISNDATLKIQSAAISQKTLKSIEKKLPNNSISKFWKFAPFAKQTDYDKYAILEPLNSIQEKLVIEGWNHYFTLGNYKLSSKAKIFIPNLEYETLCKEYPNLKKYFIQYNPNKKTIDQAVEEYLKYKKAWIIEETEYSKKEKNFKDKIIKVNDYEFKVPVFFDSLKEQEYINFYKDPNESTLRKFEVFLQQNLFMNITKALVFGKKFFNDSSNENFFENIEKNKEQYKKLKQKIKKEKWNKKNEKIFKNILTSTIYGLSI